MAPRPWISLALGLAVAARSGVASAQLGLGSAGDGLAIGIVVGAGFAGYAGATGERWISGKDLLYKRPAGVGLFVLGVHMAMATTIPLGLVSDESVAELTAIAGSFWSLTGVGLGRTLSLSRHSTFLGGSVGLTFFAFERGLMVQVGAADRRSANIIQAVYAGVGGVGCALDAGFSGGAERWVGVGCSVVAGLALTHGVVRAAIGVRQSGRGVARSITPVPIAREGALGLGVAGVF